MTGRSEGKGRLHASGELARRDQCGTDEKRQKKTRCGEESTAGNNEGEHMLPRHTQIRGGEAPKPPFFHLDLEGGPLHNPKRT